MFSAMSVLPTTSTSILGNLIKSVATIKLHVMAAANHGGRIMIYFIGDLSINIGTRSMDLMDSMSPI